MIEYKNFDFKIKAMEDGMFEGYGSIFGNVDSHRDIVVKGAFNRTINNNMNRIKILWQHDVREPIGKPVEMYEDSKGLYIKARLCLGSDTGKKCYELMKDGIINELSIGYDTLVEEYDKMKNARLLKEVRLWEVSAVTFASNELATVNQVKNIDSIIQELKEGRRFSKVNKGKIEEVISLLMELIGEDDEEYSDSETSTRYPSKPKNIQITSEDDFHVILSTLKNLKNNN